MPIIEGLEQQSPEWIKQRIGCCTASRLIDVVTRLKRGNGTAQKGDYGKARHDYMTELIGERLSGRAADHYVTPYMQEGIDNEPLAKAAYEYQFGVELEPGGFALHDKIPYFGASVDALIGKEGCAEFKCLKLDNHLDILDAGEIPAQYFPQMLGELACYNRQWIDFVSFNPDLPPGIKLFVRRWHRDEALVAQLEKEVELFLDDLIVRLQRISKYQPIPEMPF